MSSRPIRPLPAALAVGFLTALFGLAASSINASGGWIAGAVVAGVGAFLIARRYRSRLDGDRKETLGRLESLISTHTPGREPDSVRTPSDESDIVSVLAVLGYRLDLLGQVVQAFDSAVVVLGHDHRIELANPAAGALLVSDPGDLIGQDLSSVFTEAAVHALCERAGADGSASARIRMVGENSASTYESVALSISVAGEQRIILMLRDVTELAQADALKTDFVGNASHELRTPITAIRGAVETLLGPAREDESMRTRLAEMIQSHALRLEELVGDLLDLSRLETPERVEAFDRVDLFELCAKIGTLLEPMLSERGVELSLELDEALHEVWTSERAIRLVLRNLMDNAIKFSHEGGRVRVVGTVRGSGLETVRIEVIDEGIGIPLAQQPRVFERFFQVDDARSGSHPSRGTGLGLSIVKHALRRIGGSIEVESVWNEGTTMVVEFPGRAATSAPGM